jgi:hypothetical protein
MAKQIAIFSGARAQERITGQLRGEDFKSKKTAGLVLSG